MKNLGLQAKLFILSGVLLFMCALTGVVGYFITQSVVSSYQKIAEFDLPNIQAILSAQAVNRSARLQVFRLATPGLSKENKEIAIKNFNEDWKVYDQRIKEYLDVPFGPGEEALYKALEPQIKTMRELMNNAVDAYKKMKDENDVEGRKHLVEAIQALEKATPSFKKAQDEIVKYHDAAAKINATEATAAKNSGTKMLIGIIVGSIAIGLFIAFALSKSLVKIFKDISLSLTQSGVEVSSAAEQVAASSEQLSQAVHEQASAIQETASSLEELSSTIAKNTDTSKQAADSSKRTQDSASHGKTVVTEMITSMNEINKSNSQIVEQIKDSNQKISEIVQVITEIGNKTKVINDIVFQTKLLSFNASVEAARAGEHGKGFAVVAEEVGNLARMSGNAATEISAMLDESIRNVTSIVEESQEKVNRIMDEGKKKVDRGANIAEECGKVFNLIYDEIAVINSMSSEISNASMEQSSGVGEISRAMNQVDQATHQNSSASQQAASAAEELSAQAVSMKLTVEQLIRIVEGGKGENIHHRTSHSSPISSGKRTQPAHLKEAS